jgi:hypothetical protein
MLRLISVVRIGYSSAIFLSGYLKSNLRFAERNVSLHLLDINLSNSLILILPVHMDVHDVFSDCLIISYIHSTSNGQLTRSLASLCSSLTMKIISKRDKIVVWKSIFSPGDFISS